ncbi:efflux RND transporter periplasmic adaptor subunit [Emticicia sp. BO119]|uniref:efflux RND transporter periplasmic adaptor subunit n=1 Tax=Emticicia sp. BO119 TaxID=2757768 RepID=UPI0015F0D57D|nr:efflux RND transporter periplasmic adaptor subunit [Emticicia sp. BO119]MBA4853223.1 efflux RND transporter periplasmic adaptor subunit [Emticicia sp. BO119]
MKIYFFLSVLLATGLASCSKKAETTVAIADTSKAQPEVLQIKITPEQFKNLNLSLGHFREMAINDEIKATGMADVPPENSASVSIPITGFVKTIFANNALPGRFVTKGTVLATVESIEFIQMQQDYFQAVAHSVFLEKELERQQTLSAEDIGVKKKLQQAEAEFNSNQALIKALEAKLKMLGINIATLKKGETASVISLVTPISGYIKSTNINTGKSVTPNDVLFELISKEHLHVELKVLEKDAFRIQKGQKVLIDDKRLGDKVVGTVFLVGQTFEDESKAINIHVHLDNEQQEQKLIPGMFISARILAGTRTAKTLSESAILRESDGNFIISLEKQNNKEVIFRKIPVKLGANQGQDIEIQSVEDLDDSTIIVTDRVHFLSGMGGTDED